MTKKLILMVSLKERIIILRETSVKEENDFLKLYSINRLFMRYKDFKLLIKEFKTKEESEKISFEKLIQKINEFYFDIIDKDYHPDFSLDMERWEKIANEYLKREHPLKILDIGTGSGFIPLIVAKYNKKEDTFICSDISNEILKLAKNNIEKQKFQCKFEFLKIESQIPYKLPYTSNFLDVITMNSVLHHINDVKTFLYEVNRILKPKGLLIIGHEPNKYFYQSKILWINYLLIKNIRIGIGKIYKKKSKTNEQNDNFKLRQRKIKEKINNLLLKENLIKKPLSYQLITLLVDLKSIKGFKPDKLLKNYDILQIETYNHFFAQKRYIDKIYDKFLRKLLPKKGATFTIVLRKQ